jgi:hypothetical protein
VEEGVVLVHVVDDLDGLLRRLEAFLNSFHGLRDGGAFGGR